MMFDMRHTGLAQPVDDGLDDRPVRRAGGSAGGGNLDPDDVLRLDEGAPARGHALAVRHGEDKLVHHRTHTPFVGRVRRDGERVADGENLRAGGGLRGNWLVAAAGRGVGTGVGGGVGWSMPARAAAAASGVSGVGAGAAFGMVPGRAEREVMPSHSPATAIMGRQQRRTVRFRLFLTLG